MLNPYSHEDLADFLAGRVEHLLPRKGRELPGLLKLALDVAKDGNDDQKLALAQRSGIAVKSFWVETEKNFKSSVGGQWKWPEGDAPWERADRLVNDLMQKVGRSSEVNNRSATLSDDPAHARFASYLCRDWLIEEATSWVQGQQTSGLANLDLKGDLWTDSSIRLLLRDHRGGKVGKLTLYRRHRSNARLALAPAPASALTPCFESFHQALQVARKYWLSQVKDPRMHDTALAWDIVTPNAELWSLGGPSAGAALALCGLWLLRDLLPKGEELQRALNRISKGNLARVHVTAELCADGTFKDVGAVVEKTQTLVDTLDLRNGEGVLVYTAPAEARTLRSRVEDATVEPAENLLDLANQVAKLKSSFLRRRSVPPRTQVAPDRLWCELRITDSHWPHWRLLPGDDGPTLVRSPSSGIDPILPGATLVADAEGRACAYLKGRHLQIAWLNRYDGSSIELWPAQPLTVPAPAPANLKLLSLTMCGNWGVEAVASGKQGLWLIRAEYPGTKPGRFEVTQGIRSGPCKAAIYHSKKEGNESREVAIVEKTATLTPGGVSFVLDPYEFLDAGMTESGLLYAAVGMRDKQRLLVLKWPGKDREDEPIPLAYDRVEGLVVVRNGAADDCVLVHADGRLIRLTELQREVAHAPS